MHRNMRHGRDSNVFRYLFNIYLCSPAFWRYKRLITIPPLMGKVMLFVSSMSLSSQRCLLSFPSAADGQIKLFLCKILAFVLHCERIRAEITIL